MPTEEKIDLDEIPSSSELRRLLLRIQKGEETAFDELYDKVDEIAKENIVLKETLKSLHTSISNAVRRTK